ncbi:hypothetical protein PV08_00709 [Exophiala spinifera]|uniref:Serine aminopeptidase S33 domain-containing protein n=1 Tax=Exophiala spinifera TaxID=91928 RepID=A0A0D2C986_9EURO|nr:uncharacterized protein PV08_00709 [Exophiala spinifera]KIW20134.1 hypothetical protein PV08_00709 [Exophiala spinifera]
MTVTSEAEFATKDGTKLYTKSWKPDSGNTSAVLMFLHGFSDHINAYYDLFPTLSSAPFNIAVYGFDQRGWGRSVHKTSDQGLTGPTSLVISDIHDFILHVSGLDETHNKPLFLMGHSMGGNELLTYMLSTSSAYSNRPPISGVLLEAPYIELDPSEQPNAVTVVAGKMAASLLPHMQLKRALNAAFLSRSTTVQRDFINDSLCHDTGTLEGLKGLLQRAGDLSALSHGRKVSGLTTKVPCPVLVSHGTDDKIISFPAAERLFSVLDAPGGDKVFQAYKGGYHKLHAEPEGGAEQFANDVGNWILAHANHSSSGTQVSA